MKAKTMKVLAGLSLVLMVFSILPSGALAEEIDTAEEEIDQRFERRINREGIHAKIAEHRMDKDCMERPEFETEEEELEFVKERILNGAERRTEKIQNAIENIDQINNEEVTEETLNERLADTETLIEDIGNASDLDELKEIMEEFRENHPGPERDGGRFAPHRHPEFCEETVTE